jgi:sec-independent protein translocase protein TatA
MKFGWPEILLIVAILLLLFGGKRIPEMMRGLGRGAKEFKEGMRGDDDGKDKNEPRP